MPKSKYFQLLLLNLLFCLPILASDIHDEKDACFFRITTNDDSRKIYVLGSVHNVKIEDSLPKVAFEEFKKIAQQEKLFLYTEHKGSNVDALELINNAKTKDNWTSSVLTKNHESLLNDVLSIEEGKYSNITIKDLTNIELWLAAPILSTHTGILFYPNFEGTEYDLENREPWKNNWSGVGYLEGPEHYELLKRTAARDTQHNIGWAKNSLKKLLLIKSILKKTEGINDEIEQEAIQIEKEASLKEMEALMSASKANLRSNGWEVIKHDGQGIPQSVILRNELWANTIVSNLLNHNSYLVVVGNGHLAGFRQNTSFLNYLINKLNTKKVDRFINKTKSWKNVFQ